MPTVLITGAARGLGLEFARQYRADGWDVVATARQPTAELEALGVDVRSLARVPRVDELAQGLVDTGHDSYVLFNSSRCL